MDARTYPPARLAWTVWALGAALHLAGFFQRVAPAVMTRELSSAFGLSGTALGNLSAFYFFTYVAMQVPTGILADRWGPRRLLTAGAAVASAGTLLFALAPGLGAASAGRLLIGGSVAVGFVGMLKLTTHWFSPRHFALVSGMSLVTGTGGAVFAGVPLRLAVDAFGWREVMAASALATLALSAATWIVVRDDPAEKGYRSFFAGATLHPMRSVLDDLREVLRHRNTWLLSFVPAGIVGTLLSFSGLWGVPYLTTAYGMSAAEAAAAASTALIGWGVGGPVLGAASDRLRRRKPLYVACVLVLLTGWSIVFFALPARPLLAGLLAMVGFCSGILTHGYAFAKDSVPAPLAGTVSGIVNTGLMTGPMVLQPSIGWMLDRLWGGAVQDGARLYDLHAYRAGFALAVAWLAASLVAILFTVETHCRQRTAESPESAPVGG